MPAIHNIQISQTTQRPASLSPAGPALKADTKAGDQDQSFENALSDQADVSAVNETDRGVITDDVKTDKADFIIKTAEGSDINADVAADFANIAPNPPVPATTLAVSIPLDDTVDTLAVADVSTAANRNVALPSLGNTAETTAGQAPLVLAAESDPRATESSKLIASASASTAETAAVTAKTKSATLPTAIPAVPDTAETTETLTVEEGDVTDRPRLSERAAETADYRAVAKPTAGPSDLAKLADTPANPATVLTSSDASTPLKSVPVIPVTPTLTPLSGMSDRLAATILQTTQSQPTVTLDKLPQAVIAISLSGKSATLQIDPPELGRIRLEYQFDSQGRTVVTMTPESDAARAALMDRMASITAALEQGTNSPVDVKLGDARDFGSEFGQASQEGDKTQSDQQDGANNAASNTIHTDDLQRFVRAPLGEAERLHILV